MKRRLVALLVLGSAGIAFQIVRSRSDAPTQFDLGTKRFPRLPAFKELFDPEQPVPEPAPDPRISSTIRLTDDTRSNDFPDIISDPKDRSKAWCVWQSYSGRQDQVRLAYFDGKDWGTWIHIPGVSGDVWRPKLGFDGNGRLWIVWSQQVEGNFDLYARSFDGTKFGPRLRISSAPQSDFDARLATGPDGRLWVAWQGFRNGQSDIFLSRLENDRWTPELRVSESPRNDWGPAIAIDAAGTVYIAWDTYDKGNYDVVMRSYANGKLSPVIPVAATARFEAHPSLAAGRDGKIWIAYEAGPVNWGKDQGRMIPEETAPGAMLMSERKIEVVAYAGSQRLGMAPEIGPLLPKRNPKYPVMTPDPIFADPQLLVDGEDRLHLLVRNQEGLQNATYWWEYVTTLTPNGWSKAAPLPFSAGRNSMRAALAPGPGGSVWMSWPRDNDPRTSIWRVLPEETYIENVYAGVYRPDSANSGALPIEKREPAVANRPGGHQNEDAQVRAIRAYRADSGGKPLRILRGDLHRHSEFSPDLRGMPDGSALDFYRYMLDAASMDFGILSDHMAGGDREYWWWLSEKLVDLFHSPPNYVSLYGYERSVSYPQGHRNVIHTRRGNPPVPFFQKPGFAIRSHNAATEVIDNDAKLLYEEIRKSGGISIPHTSASQMGTDWRDNDKAVEPLVEIFQGDRYSAECKGCPKSDPGTRPEGSPQLLTTVEAERPAGYMDKAWAKGYRLGVIASSDHFSTHISYALVYAEAVTREAIQNAMRQRHAYAATDNIIVDFHMGEHFMGDDFTAAEAPEITAKIKGTAPLTELVLIRNSRAVYQTAPNKASAELRYRDMSPAKGLNWYYLRAQQSDGQIVWSSPIWMTLR